MKFSDPQKESAVLGYVAMHGFKGLEQSLCPGDEFTSDQWRPIYTAALRVHRAGRTVNRFTITDEISALGVSPDFAKLFPISWQNWPDLTDGSIAFSPPSVAASCLDAIHEYAGNRAAAKLGKELAEGTITPEEAKERLQAIQDAARGESHDSVLDRLKFDPAKPPAAPVRVYELAGKPFAHRQNVVVIAAKIKSGKTAVTGACIAAATGRDGDTLRVDSSNPDGLALLHFDTEQSDADHHLLVAGALCRVNLRDCPPWIQSYRITVVPRAKRFELLEHAMKRARRNFSGIHSVLLDGVADFVRDPNDPNEAFDAVERLHRLAIEFDTVIICVLHINPGSEINKTRGHLGSQLERKAESNLVVEKDENNISTVYSTTSRHAFITKQEGPRFRWDDAKGMHVSVDSAKTEAVAEASEKLRTYAEEAFLDGALKYVPARKAIMQVAAVNETRA